MSAMPLHSQDALARLAAVIESRKPAAGGDAQSSYVARLLHKGPDAFLKKIGEEATEVVMAAKDIDAGQADAEMLRGKLIERNGVAKAAAARMGRRG